jgi:ubiquinone/menaquinone biosynthesis C-methylase UbiE
LSAVSLPEGHERNADQIAFWNGVAGRHWTDRQSVQDILLAPVTEKLIARIDAQEGQRILDVGCGTGAIAIELARRVGPSGHVLGIDISVPMLDRARQLTSKDLSADYVLADATVYPFDPASFDLIVSRFGVMFFADPVLSFRNLRGALRPKGRLVFACWREPRENGWMMAPLMAVYKHVPKLPQLGPEDPGPFAFADESRVRRILGEAGFNDIAMEACPLSFDVAAGRGLEAAVQGALEIGPASRALEGHALVVVAAAVQSIREMLTPFAKGQSVFLPGAIWLVTASAP